MVNCFSQDLFSSFQTDSEGLGRHLNSKITPTIRQNAIGLIGVNFQMLQIFVYKVNVNKCVKVANGVNCEYWVISRFFTNVKAYGLSHHQ